MSEQDNAMEEEQFVGKCWLGKQEEEEEEEMRRLAMCWGGFEAVPHPRLAAAAAAAGPKWYYCTSPAI